MCDRKLTAMFTQMSRYKALSTSAAIRPPLSDRRIQTARSHVDATYSLRSSIQVCRPYSSPQLPRRGYLRHAILTTAT
jgi:hypothetical protein